MLDIPSWLKRVYTDHFQHRKPVLYTMYTMYMYDFLVQLSIAHYFLCAIEGVHHTCIYMTSTCMLIRLSVQFLKYLKVTAKEWTEFVTNWEMNDIWITSPTWVHRHNADGFHWWLTQEGGRNKVINYLHSLTKPNLLINQIIQYFSLCCQCIQ